MGRIVGKIRTCECVPHSTTPIQLQGVRVEWLQTEKGRQRAQRIFRRNMDKLPPYVCWMQRHRLSGGHGV